MIEYLAYSLGGVIMILLSALILNREVLPEHSKISKITAVLVCAWYALVGKIGFWSALVLLVISLLAVIAVKTYVYFKRNPLSDWWKDPL